MPAQLKSRDVFFSDVNLEDEKELFFALDNKTVTIWEKGVGKYAKVKVQKTVTSERLIVLDLNVLEDTSRSPAENSSRIKILKSMTPKGLLARQSLELLINFSFKNREYFLSTRVKSLGKTSLTLLCDGPIYRCERRKSYRLKVADKNALYLLIPNSYLAHLSESDQDSSFKFSENLINKNHLDALVSSQKKLEVDWEKFILVKVHDISILGASFLFNARFREENSTLDHIYLFLEHKLYRLNKVQIVHQVYGQKLDAFKIGLNFGVIGPQLDDTLSKCINKILRNQKVYLKVFEQKT